MPNKNKSTHPINLVAEDGTPVATAAVAGMINDFFTTVAAKLDVHDDAWPDPCQITDTSFELKAVNLKNINDVISNICITKSSGLHYISSKVLKDAFEAVPHVLLHIMNVAINTNIFPTEWKNATIIPLEKKTKCTHTLRV